MRIMPYKFGSKSARALAQALGVQRVRRDKGEFRNNFNHVILNWGSGVLPHFHKDNTRYINHPHKVEVASNKLKSFVEMQDKARTPEWTQSKEVASEWIREGHTVFCRTLLRGHSGRGILSVSNVEGLVDCPLYVKYVKKKEEYRIHVCKVGKGYPHAEGEPYYKVIDVQLKRKRNELDNDDVNFQVRNAANGWVFCREGVEPPPDVVLQATAAVRALGLDFGAVDVGFNELKGEAYVFEVNTACGLEGTTIDKYVKAIKEI